jgi:hypothetical protein
MTGSVSGRCEPGPRQRSARKSGLATGSILTNSWQAFAAAGDAIDKSPNWSIERARSLRRMVVRSARLHRKLARRGCSGNRTKSCVPAAFGIENSVLHPTLHNIGATLKDHETILRSHIFVVVGLRCFRARRVDPCPRHQLLGE